MIPLGDVGDVDLGMDACGDGWLDFAFRPRTTRRRAVCELGCSLNPPTLAPSPSQQLSSGVKNVPSISVIGATRRLLNFLLPVPIDCREP